MDRVGGGGRKAPPTKTGKFLRNLPSRNNLYQDYSCAVPPFTRRGGGPVAGVRYSGPGLASCGRGEGDRLDHSLRTQFRCGPPGPEYRTATTRPFHLWMVTVT